MATIFYASSLSLCDLRQQAQAKRVVPVSRSCFLGLGFCSGAKTVNFGFGFLGNGLRCLRKEKKKEES